MQDTTHLVQNEELAALGETGPTGQPEPIEIRLLDKIETIESKAIDS
ncbi:hypothetical protein ACIQPQ_08255 [Streptomyces sp. NPDC091281]